MSYCSDQSHTKRRYLTDPSADILLCLVTCGDTMRCGYSPVLLTLCSVLGTTILPLTRFRYRESRVRRSKGHFHMKGSADSCSKDSGLPLHNSAFPKLLFELGSLTIYSEHTKLLFHGTLGETLHVKVTRKLWVMPRDPEAGAECQEASPRSQELSSMTWAEDACFLPWRR